MKAFTVLLLSIGLVPCLANKSDPAKRFILSFVDTDKASSSCSDKLGNCDAYEQSVCTDQNYASWAKENCKARCNLCSSGSGGGLTPPNPVSSSGCSDKLTNCNQYDSNACQTYQQWATENCAKTCNLCPSSGGNSGGGPVPSSGGGAIQVSSSGCVYGGQVYQQGQTWKDACKYNCECTDGASGKYQCRQLCLDWNLPSACHMNPPGPGKCCPQPACPSYITLQYPPGYTPE